MTRIKKTNSKDFGNKLRNFIFSFSGTCLVMSSSSCPRDRNEHYNDQENNPNSEINTNPINSSSNEIATINDIKTLATAIFADMIKGYIKNGELGFEYDGKDAFLTTKDPSKKLQLVKNGSFVSTFNSQDLQLILNKANGANGENPVLDFNENTTFKGKTFYKIVQDFFASGAIEYVYTNNKGNEVKGKLDDIVNAIASDVLIKETTQYAYNDGTAKEGTFTNAARALAQDEIKNLLGSVKYTIIGSDAPLLNMNTKINVDDKQGATFTHPASTAGDIGLVKELVKIKEQFEMLKNNFQMLKNNNDIDRYFDLIYSGRSAEEKERARKKLEGLNYKGRIKSSSNLDLSKNANQDEFYKLGLKTNDVVLFENASGNIRDSVFVKILKDVNQNSIKGPIVNCVDPLGNDGNFYGVLNGDTLGGSA